VVVVVVDVVVSVDVFVAVDVFVVVADGNNSGHDHDHPATITTTVATTTFRGYRGTTEAPESSSRGTTLTTSCGNGLPKP